MGAEVEVVRFGPYQVDFSFSGRDELNLAVQGSYEHTSVADGGWRDAVTLPVDSSRLMRLCGKWVIDAQVESPQSLLLSFADGQTLRVLDDTPQYEAFSICRGEDLWIV